MKLLPFVLLAAMAGDSQSKRVPMGVITCPMPDGVGTCAVVLMPEAESRLPTYVAWGGRMGAFPTVFSDSSAAQEFVLSKCYGRAQ